MNANLQIQKLWQYLGIQDNEVLIVRHNNPSDGKDEYLIVEAVSDGLKITTTDTLPTISPDIRCQIIQQRDSSGKFIIPSVDQLINDKINDY